MKNKERKQVKTYAIGVSQSFEDEIQEAYALLNNTRGSFPPMASFLRVMLHHGVQDYLETGDYCRWDRLKCFREPQPAATSEGTMPRQETGVMAKIIPFRAC